MTTNAAGQAVTLVTQTQVVPGKEQDFAAWQQRIGSAVAGFAGFLGQAVMPPAPPTQTDWVIVQRFSTLADSQRWLRSPEREALLLQAEPFLTGTDDIHSFSGTEYRPPNASVAAVISTRVRPGQEEQFRAWQRRITAAEATFPGYLGSRLEPPIAGVQNDWATVVRFDTNEHLQAWLDSPQRRQLLESGAGVGDDFRLRTVQVGFGDWFALGDGDQAPVAAWKQNMVVLLVLYPVVFLFGAWVQNPLLLAHGMPFWLALFVGNAISVFLLGYVLVPQAGRLLRWWLAPEKAAPRWTNPAGIALVFALYCVALAIFSRFA